MRAEGREFVEFLKRRSGIAACVLLLVGLLVYVVWQFVFAGRGALADAWMTLNEPMEQLLAPGAEGVSGDGMAGGRALPGERAVVGNGQSAGGAKQGPRVGEVADGAGNASIGGAGQGLGVGGQGEIVGGAGNASIGGAKQGEGSGEQRGTAGGGIGQTAGSGMASNGAQRSDANSAVSGSSLLNGQQRELRLELNTATLEQLDALPGIGASKAKAIVAYRAEAGSFRSVDELIHVKGIGEKLLAKIRPYVYVAAR